MTDCRFDDAVLAGFYGEGVRVSNLSLTPADEAGLLVDDLEMVQLMEALLMKSRWHDLFAARSLRLVLVLGSFAGWRRDHLDALREVLRRRDYVPVVVDLENRVGRKLREGIGNLAHLARFMIADLAGSREFVGHIRTFGLAIRTLPLQSIVPEGEEFIEIPGVPAQEPYRYRDTEHLIETFDECVLHPIEEKLEAVS